MKKMKILNFQDILIKNENIELASCPLRNLKKKPNHTYTVILRDPYDYIDSLLYEMMQTYHFSPTLTHIATLKEPDTIIAYLKEKNFFPIFNPQTFCLDARKRVEYAHKNLKLFDYIVDYKDIHTFAQEFNLDITVPELKKQTIHLSRTPALKTLIEQDIKLYKQAFDPQFRTDDIAVPEYRGYVDNITDKSIAGWVLVKGKDESYLVSLYIDHKKVQTVKADIFRPRLKEKGLHPSGKCGFIFKLPHIRLSPKNHVQVKLEKYDFLLHDGPKVKEFFKKDHS